MEKVLIHKNVWHWGRSDTIVLANGRALCNVSFENDNCSVAYLSGVSVYEPSRHNGLGNELLKVAIKHAREMGAHLLCLWTPQDKWMMDWYKRHGFREYATHKNGMVGLEFDLDNGN